jgi:hypothetical protein
MAKQEGEGRATGELQRNRLPVGSIKLTRAGQREVEEQRAAADRALRREKESVTQGAIDRVIDLAFNPSREKLREVTIIDRMQGRLFPLIDTTNFMMMECLKIAIYRQSPNQYMEIFEEECPSPISDPMGEYLIRTAQWQKSVAGKNLERATDIALAETEKGTEEDEQYTTSRGYED